MLLLISKITRTPFVVCNFFNLIIILLPAIYFFVIIYGMDIFGENLIKTAPLAERMRPTNLDEFVGQSHIVGKNSLLRRAILADRLGSCIFYGPPGTGKTTLASIIAKTTNSNFTALNAVSSGAADVKKVIDMAKQDKELTGRQTYLLLDECHRWSKAQSDCMLEAIEKGYVIFIGSTTENPFTSMTRAIVSRCRIFKFEPLTKEDIKQVILRSLDDPRGLSNFSTKILPDALDHLILTCGGDARVALGALELAVLTTPPKKGVVTITKEIVGQCMQGKVISVDTDLYYDMLSAFCKSLRGSDADAAVYWSQRLIKAGCDPLLILRRLIAHASEDVGLANSQALVVAVSALTAYQNMGMPEGLIPLTHAIIYVAMSPKSNSTIVAMYSAQDDVEKTYNDAVPSHLKNTNYLNEKREKYKYPHDFGGYVEQQYLPTEIASHVYYVPSKNGSEKNIVLPDKKLQNLAKQSEKTNQNCKK